MAWRALSWAEQGLYIAMRRKLNASNNGNIEATLTTLKHSGISSSASLAKGLRALMAVGLIAKTREGHLSQGRKVCNLFRFTDDGTYEFPKLGLKSMGATNEWKTFRTLADAQRAIKAAHAAAKTGVPRRAKNAAPVQILNRTSSKTELIAISSSSNSEHGGPTSVQKLKLAQGA